MRACCGRFVKDRLAAELQKIDRANLSDAQTAERALAEAHERTQEALKSSGIDVSLSGRHSAWGGEWEARATGGVVWGLGGMGMVESGSVGCG